MKCPLQREQDRAQKQLAFPRCPSTKAGLRGRTWAGTGVWRRGELKPQSPGLSAAATRRPPPSVLVPGQHSSLTTTPAPQRHQPHNDTSPEAAQSSCPEVPGARVPGRAPLPRPRCPWPGSLRPPTLWGKSWPQDKCLLRECKLIEGVAL